jgi:hypothetical protein
VINHRIRRSCFPAFWKKIKLITLPKIGKDPKFPPNLRQIRLLSTTGNIFENVNLKVLKRHIEERSLLNQSRFGFRARHITTLQCMRLTDHVTLNFNNNRARVAVFFNTEKAFDTTWHPGLLYKLSTLEFSTILIKLISCFLSHTTFRVSVEGEVSTRRKMQTSVPQGYVLSLILGVYVALFADDNCIYVTDRKKAHILSKLQRGLSPMESWYKCWNIELNDVITQAICFSH